jgi:hypothetical protein
VRSWFLASVHHRAVDVKRKLRREVTTEMATDGAPQHSPADTVPDAAERRLVRRELRHVIDGLPEDQREIILLAYFEGYTHREIAEGKNIPLGTVKSRIRLGMDPDAATPVAATDRAALDRDMAALGLYRNMTGQQVRSVLGQPVRVAPMEAPEGAAEVWTFRRSVVTGTREVQTGVRDVPWMDPVSGESRMLQEPVYGLETTFATEEIELLIFEDRLLDWKRKWVDSRRSIL